MKNIGPVSARWLARAGITSVAEIEQIGVAETWLRVQALWPQASRNLLWALQAAVLDIDWRDLPAELKAELETQLPG